MTQPFKPTHVKGFQIPPHVHAKWDRTKHYLTHRIENGKSVWYLDGVRQPEAP